MSSNPRVAFFADSFHEVNGVANTSRQFEAYARRRGLPFLSVHAAPHANYRTDGTITTFELNRGPAAFAIERDMSFDPLMMRHRQWGESVLRSFRPDVLHLTGPSDIGILGAWLADRLNIPLVASWHTNIHEFGARRLDKLISFMSPNLRDPITQATETGILAGCARFYQMASVLLAPNQELVDMLVERTGRPSFLMQRGVDTRLYSPAKRQRTDSTMVLGYVGRITPEKNVRLLVEVERALIEAGHKDFRFKIIGDGSETEWLKQNLRQADFSGVLRGEALARAYADLDVFLFPSHTDTFGNVILEAAASGVPSIVTASGGPKFLVQDGVSGYVAADHQQFVARALSLMIDGAVHARMRDAALHFANTMSWDAVFERVYGAYELALELNPRASYLSA